LNPHAGDEGLIGTEEEEIIKPAKIPKPPNVGITVLCTFLPSGSSNNFLDSATSIMAGMEKNVIMNASPQLKNIFCIPFFY
jgi:hypothetical protein